MKRHVLRLCFCLMLAGLAVALNGCATGNEDSQNASVRPWNSPQGWESGLPSNMMEGR